RCSKIQFAIEIEINRNKGHGGLPSGKVAEVPKLAVSTEVTLESAVAAAQENGNDIGPVVGDGDVGAAILVKVAADNRACGPACTEHAGRPKSAIAISQEDVDVVRSVIPDHKVGLSIAIEIARRQHARYQAGGGSKGRPKNPRDASREDRDVVADLVH